HLYEEDGSACLEKLNGQFAFAIWDTRKKELFLARDRTGIVPLHYTLCGGRLVFGSELKSIFQYPGVDRELDPVGLDQVFTFWTTLPGRTAFKGVQELAAGCSLTAGDGRIDVRRYWDFPFLEPQFQRTIESTDGLVEEISELLLDSIRIRLRADVPVGSYLSGGIDSSGLTALIRKNFNNQLRTFGLTFEEKDFDERQYQEAMVRFLEVDHTSVEATNELIQSSFSQALWYCEKPLLRTAPVPLFLLSGHVRESGYKVVVTGEGADEVFGGYNIFREAKVRAFWARQPESTIRPMLIGKLYPYIFKDKRLERSLQSFFGTGLDQVANPFFSHLIRWNNTSKAKTFFSKQMKEALSGYNGIEDLESMLPNGFERLDPVSRAQYLEMKVFMSSYLLSSQGDRVAMGHAVEARPPYLDHRLIEFMATIPTALKIIGLNEKSLLKKVLKGSLPDEILRRSKHPYRAPIRKTFVSSDSGVDLDHLSEESITRVGIFDPAKVSLLLKKARHASRISETDEMALAGVLSTQIIHHQYVDNFQSRSVTLPSYALSFDRRDLT
ncbi:MAG: asparagine synthase (glutamine-hydrolyzing), partial [Thermovirgaceae bacterium]|nr:asparagine synthase (glutamine-hydrolyzing) [Thermovirgaceae bacterium]